LAISHMLHISNKLKSKLKQLILFGLV